MTKFTLPLCFLLLIVSSPLAWANMPFDLSDNNKSVDTGPLALAEQMRLSFSTPLTADESPNSLTPVKNPFLNQLPKKDAGTPQPTLPGDQNIQALPQEVKEPIPQFTLAGLVWNSIKPQAILENKVVGIGDDINGWTIVDISSEGVLMESLSQTRHLIEP